MPNAHVPAADIGLPSSSAMAPNITDMHDDAAILRGLIEAMDALSEHIGPKGNGLYACINRALPLSVKLSQDLERLMDHAA